MHRVVKGRLNRGAWCPFASMVTGDATTSVVTHANGTENKGFTVEINESEQLNRYRQEEPFYLFGQVLGSDSIAFSVLYEIEILRVYGKNR
jgi:hypothetical protein